MPHKLDEDKMLSSEAKRWTSLFRQSNAALKASKAKRRLELLEESLKIARRIKEMQLHSSPDSPEMAKVADECLVTSLRELGLAYYNIEEDDSDNQCMPYLLETLEILEPAQTPDYKSLFSIYEALCDLYSKKGQSQKYEDICRRALTLKEKEVGQWHHQVISYLMDLSWALEEQGKYKESAALKKDALGIAQNDDKSSHVDLIAIKHGLAYANFRGEGMSDMEAVQKALAELDEDERKQFTGRVAEELQSLR